MGEIRSVQCRACGAKWQCMEGAGLLYGKKENVIAAFLEQERAEAAARIESSAIPVYDFRYGLAVCAYCHSVVSVPVLRLSEEEKPYVGHCPQCGKKTKNLCRDEQELEAWSKKTACPVCKVKKLEITDDGCWD